MMASMDTDDRNTDEHRKRAVKALLAAIEANPGHRIGELAIDAAVATCNRKEQLIPLRSMADGDLADGLEQLTP